MYTECLLSQYIIRLESHANTVHYRKQFKITQMLVDERRIVVVSMYGVSVVLLLYLSSVHVNKNCTSSLYCL